MRDQRLIERLAILFPASQDCVEPPGYLISQRKLGLKPGAEMLEGVRARLLPPTKGLNCVRGLVQCTLVFIIPIGGPNVVVCMVKHLCSDVAQIPRYVINLGPDQCGPWYGKTG